jgi:broad specificity phosphatase PhoE
LTRLVFVRHADHGLLGRRLVGRTSGVRLSPDGERDAEALAERLAVAPIRALYCSPLERARATARPLAARLGLDARVADELNEVDFGDWSDRSFSDLDEGAEWRRYNSFRSGVRAPGGESISDVLSRVLDLVHRLCSDHGEQMVALVSHGDVIKTTLAYYLGVPLDLFQRIEISPASISIVRIGRYGPEVLLINGGVEERLLQT